MLSKQPQTTPEPIKRDRVGRVILAEAGCTVPDIATITGHSRAHAQKIFDRYLARTRTLARSAIAKLEDHRRTRQMETKMETGA